MSGESKELTVIEVDGNNFFAMQANAFALKKRCEELKRLSDEKKAEFKQKEEKPLESVQPYEEATQAFDGYLQHAYKFRQQIEKMKLVKSSPEIPKGLLDVGPLYSGEDLITLADMRKKTGDLFRYSGNAQKAIYWYVEAFNGYSFRLQQTDISILGQMGYSLEEKKIVEKC